MQDDEASGCARKALVLREDALRPAEAEQALAQVADEAGEIGAWAAVVLLWLEDAGSAVTLERIHAVVRPGCDFMTCLTSGVLGAATRYMRSIDIDLSSSDSTAMRRTRLHGRLEWSDPGGWDVAEGLHAVYP